VSIGKGPIVFRCVAGIDHSNSRNKIVSQQYTGVGDVVV